MSRTNKVNILNLTARNILLIFFVFCIFNIAKSQKVTDTTISTNSNKHNPTAYDSISKYNPPDLRFIPADYLYDHNWDNANVRVHRVDLSHKKDTTKIIFCPDSGFCFPHKGKVISPFGFRGRQLHTGMDIKLNMKDSVFCAFDGMVRMAKKYGGYGKVVVIRHYNGLETLYGHLSYISVHVNQFVKAGDLIGLGGKTGRATSPHLHFETRFLGEAFNPKIFIDFDKFSLLKDTLLLTGTTFQNYYKGLKSKGKTSKTKSVAAKNPTKQNTTINTKTGNYHMVKEGDTLYRIAKNNGTTVENLCKLNNISKNKVLSIGMKIKVK
ncbi:MAG: M23 family metallopeptidase [Bacteroidales bacterium]|jgi:murein DD-endopeptidase MepM/ murein hydrolase activator NlpD